MDGLLDQPTDGQRGHKYIELRAHEMVNEEDLRAFGHEKSSFYTYVADKPCLCS